jgi:ATP-dependent DNA ligase
MLAQITEDFGEVLAAHGSTSALEYKYDGARINSTATESACRSGRAGSPTSREACQTSSRRLDTARRRAVHPRRRVLALDPAGRPLPFQELMRRFRRVHEVDRLVRGCR